MTHTDRSKPRWLASILVGLGVFAGVTLATAQHPPFSDPGASVPAVVGFVAAIVVAGRLAGANSPNSWMAVGLLLVGGLFALVVATIGAMYVVGPP